MIKPITPKEVEQNIVFPDEVISAFNKLIQENYRSANKEARFLQDEIVNQIIINLGRENNSSARREMFDKGYLDVEELYIKTGWDVRYNKPSIGEDFEAYFIFSRK